MGTSAAGCAYFVHHHRPVSSVVTVSSVAAVPHLELGHPGPAVRLRHHAAVDPLRHLVPPTGRPRALRMRSGGQHAAARPRGQAHLRQLGQDGGPHQDRGEAGGHEAPGAADGLPGAPPHPRQPQHSRHQPRLATLRRGLRPRAGLAGTREMLHYTATLSHVAVAAPGASRGDQEQAGVEQEAGDGDGQPHPHWSVSPLCHHGWVTIGSGLLCPCVTILTHYSPDPWLPASQLPTSVAWAHDRVLENETNLYDNEMEV